MATPDESNQARERERQEAFRREHRSQLRGLLWLALAALLFLLYRARPLLLFQPNWWRP
jgi:hypothetical protein